MKPAMSVLGIDIAKRVFHAVGMDERGKIVLRKRLSRHDLMPRPSKTRGNSCRCSQDVDGPRYDGRSKSAQSALACGLPGVALAMWIEADTLALRR